MRNKGNIVYYILVFCTVVCTLVVIAIIASSIFKGCGTGSGNGSENSSVRGVVSNTTPQKSNTINNNVEEESIIKIIVIDNFIEINNIKFYSNTDDSIKLKKIISSYNNRKVKYTINIDKKRVKTEIEPLYNQLIESLPKGSYRNI